MMEAMPLEKPVNWIDAVDVVVELVNHSEYVSKYLIGLRFPLSSLH